MYTLVSNTPYEQIEQARGQLANKLKTLIDEHGDDNRVYQLAVDYVNWWNTSFDDKNKDSVGRSIWSRADELAKSLATTSPVNVKTTNSTVTSKIGKAIGKGIGYAAVGTILAGGKTGSWFKRSGGPALAELCKAIGSGTKESYTNLRSKQSNTVDATDTSTTNDDDSPY